MRRRSIRGVPPAVLVLPLAVVLGCAALRLSTPEGEARLGGELALYVEQSLGLVEREALRGYVARVGHRLVEASPGIRRDVGYAFHVVDVAAPNAFALPGGFVYLSRGLLALLDTEDELAAVLAHEIAHVSARHHLKHAVRSSPLAPVRLAAGIGGGVVGLIFPGMGRAVAALGSAPGALMLASHGRAQEREADVLGQGYAALAGWDPTALADVMDALAAEEALAGDDPERSDFFATHPTSPDRARRAREHALALEWARRGVGSSARDRFLARLDGLLVGARADDGVVVGREFLHPVLRLGIAFPEGWRISDDGASVRAVAPREDAAATLSIAAESTDPLAVARGVLRETSLVITSGPTPLRIGPLEAARATGETRAGRVDFALELVWIGWGPYVYQVVGGALETSWPARQEALFAVPRSFRALTEEDLRRVREGRLRVVEAPGGASLAELVEARDSAWSIAQTAVANGLATDAVPERGRRLKLGILEPWTPPERDASSD